MVKGTLVGNTGMDRLLDILKKADSRRRVCEDSVKQENKEIKAKCWSTELMK